MDSSHNHRADTGGGLEREKMSKDRERQALIDCYRSGQIDTAAFIDHCNADPGLLEMWEAQRNDK